MPKERERQQGLETTHLWVDPQVCFFFVLYYILYSSIYFHLGWPPHLHSTTLPPHPPPTTMATTRGSKHVVSRASGTSTIWTTNQPSFPLPHWCVNMRPPFRGQWIGAWGSRQRVSAHRCIFFLFFFIFSTYFISGWPPHLHSTTTTSTTTSNHDYQDKGLDMGCTFTHQPSFPPPHRRVNTRLLFLETMYDEWGLETHLVRLEHRFLFFICIFTKKI